MFLFSKKRLHFSFIVTDMTAFYDSCTALEVKHFQIYNNKDVHFEINKITQESFYNVYTKKQCIYELHNQELHWIIQSRYSSTEDLPDGDLKR